MREDYEPAETVVRTCASEQEAELAIRFVVSWRIRDAARKFLVAPLRRLHRCGEAPRAKPRRTLDGGIESVTQAAGVLPVAHPRRGFCLVDGSGRGGGFPSSSQTSLTLVAGRLKN